MEHRKGWLLKRLTFKIIQVLWIWIICRIPWRHPRNHQDTPIPKLNAAKGIFFCFEKKAQVYPTQEWLPREFVPWHWFHSTLSSRHSEAAGQGDLVNCSAGGRSWYHPHGVSYITMQNARIVELGKHSPRFKKKTCEARQFALGRVQCVKLWEWSQKYIGDSRNVEKSGKGNACREQQRVGEACQREELWGPQTAAVP